MNDPELQRVWHLNASGRHAEAESHVRQVLARRPDDEWGLRLLSATLSNQGRLDEALDAASQACQHHPEAVMCWVQLSTVHVRRLDPPEAVSAAERAVVCAPTDARAHDGLARAHLAQTRLYRPRTVHDPATALVSADEAVRLAPGNVRYRNTRAWALTQLERRREAAAEYRAVLAMSPADATAINGLGWLQRDRRPIVAARHYAAALALKPQVDVFKINLLGAAMGWVYRMIWIWLWGGLGLVVLRWFLPARAVWAGLAALGVVCAVGTWRLLVVVPPRTLRLVAEHAQSSLVPMPGRLLGSVLVAVVATTASPPWAWGATGLLVAFVLLEWKVNFTDIDRKLLALLRPS